MGMIQEFQAAYSQQENKFLIFFLAIMSLYIFSVNKLILIKIWFTFLTTLQNFQPELVNYEYINNFPCPMVKHYHKAQFCNTLIL